MKTVLILFLVSFAVGACAQVQHQSELNEPGGPDPNRSVAAGTLAALENEGVIHREQVDPSKIWMRQLASQKLNKRRLRRVYYVVFALGSGEKVEAIALQDESSIPEENGLIAYVVSKVLQPDGKPVSPPRR